MSTSKKMKLSVLMAENQEEHTRARRLVAQAYASANFIAHPDHLGEAPPFMVTVEIDGDLAGAIGIYPAALYDQLPIEVLFDWRGNKIEEVVNNRRNKVFEVGRFAKPEEYKGHIETTLALFYGVWRCGLLHNVGVDSFVFAAKSYILSILEEIGLSPVEFQAKVKRDMVPREYGRFFHDEKDPPVVFRLENGKISPFFEGKVRPMLNTMFEMTEFTDLPEPVFSDGHDPLFAEPQRPPQPAPPPSQAESKDLDAIQEKDEEVSSSENLKASSGDEKSTLNSCASPRPALLCSKGKA